MKIRVWIAGSVIGGLLLGGGAGSTMAGFTASSSIAGSAQSISLPHVLPLALDPITATATSPEPSQGAKQSVTLTSLSTLASGTAEQPANLGLLTNDGSEPYAPAISLSIPGLTLMGAPGTLSPGQSASLSIGGLNTLKAGHYPLMVTVSLGNFTETVSTEITINQPVQDPPPTSTQTHSGQPPSSNTPPSTSSDAGTPPSSQ